MTLTLAPTVHARVETRPSQIVGIDVMRFLAAMMVAIYHITYISWADPGTRGDAAAMPFLAFRTWAPFVDTGWVGVQIFFVISGFVIAYTANGRSPADFIKGRAQRLVPSVWICATMSVGALLLSGSPSWEVAKAYLLSLIFFPIGPWIASSYWTLPVEIIFYALVLALLARDQFERIGLAAVTLGTSSLILWCWIFVHVSLGLDRGDHVEQLLSHRFSPLLLVPQGCFFAIGTLMWLVKVHGPSLGRIVAIIAFVAAGILEIDRETARAIAWSGIVPVERRGARHLRPLCRQDPDRGVDDLPPISSSSALWRAADVLGNPGGHPAAGLAHSIARARARAISSRGDPDRAAGPAPHDAPAHHRHPAAG
jgi:peptidoglycan/LPS O-acetylase OafA/YrhL